MAWTRKQETERTLYDEPQGDVVLEISDDKVVVCEESTYNGNEYFNIRQFYKTRDGEWGRGKGLAVPLDCAEQLFEGLSEYFANREKPKKKIVKKVEKPTSKNNKVVSRQKTAQSKGTKPIKKTTRSSERSLSRISDF
jgi:hypothetical protein